MTLAQIEKRLTTVEQQLAQLRQKRSQKPHPAEVLERIHATFENDDAFQEAARIGQKWRASQRAKPRRIAKAKSK